MIVWTMSALLETTIDNLYGEQQKGQKPAPEKEVHPSSFLGSAAESSLKLVETIGPDQSDEVIPKEEEAISLEYGLPQEFLMPGLYAPGQGLLYQSAPFYQELCPLYAANDDDKEQRPQGWVMEEQEAETMTREEAEEAIADVQYAAASGAVGEVDSRTRERLAMYFMFDPSLAQMMARMHWVTDDVDYSRRF
ncbi:hypothetical protein HY495_02070 [Candidatus Woesearchaeota archaeon]|nr:hypothetical protein [Candidatus Woesearchaeota archaeon]